MFFFLAILSTVAYSVQGTLMAHHARKMDGISTTVYRSFSLIITLLPLLFFADMSRLSEIHNFSWDFFWAGLTGALASSFMFWSLRYVPVGVGKVFRRVFGIVFAFLMGFFFFQEIPFIEELVFVMFIALGSGMLVFQKKDFSHLDNNAPKGILLSFMSALFFASAFYFVMKISRSYDPFLAGYIWESLIGVFSILIVFIRQIFGGRGLVRISWKYFGKIALVCSPTLLGTAGFLLAAQLGGFGVLSAIGAGGIFISLLLSHFIYGEKLSQKQIFWIMSIVIGIVGLKLVGV